MLELNRCYNMDCMEGMAQFPDGFFDLAVVDPPYGIETRGHAQNRFRMGESLKMVNDEKPTREYFEELFRVSKEQIIWGYNHLSDMLPVCREFIFLVQTQSSKNVCGWRACLDKFSTDSCVF